MLVSKTLFRRILLVKYLNSVKFELGPLVKMSQNSCSVAVCQMTSTSDVEANLDKCLDMIKKSRILGAKMTFLPECFDFVGESREDSYRLASTLNESQFLSAICEAAKENKIWVSLGGMHRQPKTAFCQKKVFNSHIMVDEQGQVRSVYDKLHLFSVDIADGPKLDENSFSMPGKCLKLPVISTPVGSVGLQICYDLRFPESSIALTQAGADVLTFPSAFTKHTGQAHWESLLRARAIENQVYVVAAAQVGQHNTKRASYGHAMIVDPWGKILSVCGDGDDVKVAAIDLDHLQKIRMEMPVWKHRREDVYGKINACIDNEILNEAWEDTIRENLTCTLGESKRQDDSDSDTPKDQLPLGFFKFGPLVTLSPGVIFAETKLSFAFVNRKPILPGHVLVSPKRCLPRVKELTAPEVSDFFLLCQKVGTVIEEHFEASSTTLCIQDGPEAGQTIPHVHAHILPRQKGDFERNDDIYDALAKHDKGEEAGSGWRQLREMEDEAAILRTYFQNQNS